MIIDLGERKFAQYLVDHGFQDAVRVFVKQEPHKRAKIETGRYRLIWSISLISQLLQRVILLKQTKVEIANWWKTQSCPGMGSTDADFEVIWLKVQNLMRLSGHAIDSDVVGWDLSVKRWLRILELYTMILVFRAIPGTDLFTLIWVVYILAIFGLPMTTDGVIFMLDVFGIVHSGQFKTSQGNSLMRQNLAWLRGYHVMAMGDDSIEEDDQGIERFVLFYKSLGFNVEATLIRPGDPIKFCSFTHVSRGVAMPDRWVRSLYRLLSQPKITLDFAMQFLVEIRHMDSSRRTELANLILSYVEDDIGSGGVVFAPLKTGHAQAVSDEGNSGL